MSAAENKVKSFTSAPPETDNEAEAASGVDIEHLEAVPHRFVAVNDARERDSISDSLRELWQYRALIRELMKRDLKLRYKNSIGGIAWSLLNPIMMIAVITMVMKFTQTQPVKYYSSYLFGIVFLWGFFQSVLLDGCISVLQNAMLVRKVYFPRAVLPIVSLCSNLFHFSIAFGFTLLYYFVAQTYPEQLRPQFLVIIPAVFFTAVLALGLSFILAYLNVFYEDVRFIVQSLLQMAFYTTPVFFLIEQVAARPKIYTYYMLNPIAALLVSYQRALLGPPTVMSADGKTPLPPVDIPWTYFGLACLTSTLILLFGFRLFEHYKWEISERV